MKSVNLEEYARGSFIEDRYTINDDALNILCNSSTSLSLLKCNIEILKCYTVDEKNITGDIVDMMIAKPLDENLYDMINAVLKNDKKLIFDVLNELKKVTIKAPVKIGDVIIENVLNTNVDIIASRNVGVKK